MCRNSRSLHGCRPEKNRRNGLNISTYGFLIGLALVLIIWFVFVTPMEKRMHERKMELMKRKLKRNEERLRREAANDDQSEN